MCNTLHSKRKFIALFILICFVLSGHMCESSFTYHLINIISLILETYYGEGLGLYIKLSPYY